MSILDPTKAHQKYFEELTQIPHGSYKEEGYSNYLVEFAKAHEFRYVQDDMWNVIIYKPGSAGYENHEPVILQAHMDMVCEKNKDVDFDFEKDALQLCIEDGWLKAKGTTLGADDGSGVAYMLAILDSSELAHPPLECVFTVQEEVGLFGAMNLKKEQFSAKRLINLDDGGEISTCTTSAGGVNVILKRKVAMEKTALPVYELSITGLFGGHSGGEIHKEKGNANKLLARTLYHLHQLSVVCLADVEGGLKDNAIPREASAKFTSALGYDAILAEVKQMAKDIAKELEFSDAGFTMRVKESEASLVMSVEDSDAYIRCMRLLPDGMRHHSMSIEGLTTASMNAAVVTLHEDELEINCSVRGALESYIDDIAQEVELLGKIFGFQTHREARYPSWSYDATSFMRETLQSVFKEQYHKELELVAVHGGLECGVFKALDPDMDIVTMGPIMEDIHTPKERMNLASFDRTFDLLTAYLKQL